MGECASLQAAVIPGWVSPIQERSMLIPWRYADSIGVMP